MPLVRLSKYFQNPTTLTTLTATVLVQVTLLSHLDYCNDFLMGPSASTSFVYFQQGSQMNLLKQK